MAQTFTITFDSDVLTQEQIDSARDYMFEYCGIGAFTDDFNPLLNATHNRYCIAVGSGLHYFDYLVLSGWSTPYKKNKINELTALNP